MVVDNLIFRPVLVFVGKHDGTWVPMAERGVPGQD
jgi:hypothetical protein